MTDLVVQDEAEGLLLLDEDFLAIVAAERLSSIGFDHDADLVTEREKALNYYRGEMPDVTASANRSKAVSSDVADAVETALPDLVEIFVGGDDVATFEAMGPDDEDAARAETELVVATIMDKNPGFLVFYSLIKDALLMRLGIAKCWWVDESRVDEERQAGVSPEQLPVLQQLAAERGVELVVESEGPEGLEVTIRKEVRGGCVRLMAVPPEDFAFAQDTVSLADTTYCAMRSRPRAQKLLDDGYDADKVAQLSKHGADGTDQIDLARDSSAQNVQEVEGATHELRVVEIIEHYVRVDADGDGKTELWRVVTGGDDRILLEKERVEAIPFAAITPYIITHRLMGRSLADLLLEIQRVKTALLRMLLDSGYFAMNQRMEVATQAGKANKWTLSDLLRNEPGLPIRSDDGNSVRPIQAGALAFDVTGALEFMSTVAEQRTGIARNAQGLNPDTLHDTAKGAQVLIAAAQKRIRMVARVFAETGIKDLFLIVHQLLRQHGSAGDAKLGGQWANVDPSTWPERKALKVEIGVGSGGREHDIMAGTQLLSMMQGAIQGQGGLDGPLMSPDNLHAALKRQTERLGFRNGDQFWRDPKTYQAQPKADPEILNLQSQQQIEMEKIKAKAALDMAALQQKGQLELRQIEMEIELKREQIAAETQLQALQHAGAPVSAPSPEATPHFGGEPG